MCRSLPSLPSRDESIRYLNEGVKQIIIIVKLVENKFRTYKPFGHNCFARVKIGHMKYIAILQESLNLTRQYGPFLITIKIVDKYIRYTTHYVYIVYLIKIFIGSTFIMAFNARSTSGRSFLLIGTPAALRL